MSSTRHPHCVAIALLAIGCAGAPDITSPAPAPAPSTVTVTPPDAGSSVDAGPHPGPAKPDAGPPAPVETLAAPDWFDLAAAVADRELLGAGYDKRGYTPPDGSHVLAARILDGVDQPAFAYASFGDTGFVNSDGHFWPASAIKLLAAVAALETLGSHGLTGDAVLDFEDEGGRFHRKAERLYAAALTRSSNLAFDRLVRLAGFDRINGDFFTRERGFRYAALQCPYYRVADEPTLERSPEIAWVEGDRDGVLPAREGSWRDPRCPEGANCASLFEMLDPLSRVVLHDELPAASRYAIAPIDIQRLKAYLTQSKCGFTDVVAELLGDEARIYNKRGYAPSRDMIDQALIVDRKRGRRYLLAASVPFVKRDKERAKAELAELGKHTLALISARPPVGPTLQRDAGVPIAITAEPHGEATAITVTVDDDSVDRLELWRGNERLVETAGQRLELDLALDDEPVILLVRAYAGKQATGYRAVPFPRPQ